MNQIIKADFHVHGFCSPDSLSKGDDLVAKAKELGLGKLILTDHNTIAGAVELQKKYPDFVIVGEEILTTQGEILALFVKEEIPKFTEPIEAFERLREQNAFISLSHPYAPMRHGWSEQEMIGYLPFIDAIEIANGRNMAEMNIAAKNFAEAHGLCGTAGSDAHDTSELGSMCLELPDFNNADELRESIKTAKVVGKESPQWVRYYSRKAVLFKAVNRIFHVKLYRD